MGAWGAGAFDNDDAADWSWGFENADQAAGVRLIAEALSAAAEADGADYLDAPDGACAIAAAEAVASINGHPIDESAYNETMRQWITRTRPPASAALTDLARQAVNRVTATQNSELAQLWGEAGSSPWHPVIAELLTKGPARHDRRTSGDTYEIPVEPGTTITAPRTISREIRRHETSNYQPQDR